MCDTHICGDFYHIFCYNDQPLILLCNHNHLGFLNCNPVTTGTCFNEKIYIGASTEPDIFHYIVSFTEQAAYHINTLTETNINTDMLLLIAFVDLLNERWFVCRDIFRRENNISSKVLNAFQRKPLFCSLAHAHL